MKSTQTKPISFEAIKKCSRKRKTKSLFHNTTRKRFKLNSNGNFKETGSDSDYSCSNDDSCSADSSSDDSRSDD